MAAKTGKKERGEVAHPVRSRGSVALARQAKTEEEIAARLGISRASVGHYRTGRRNPGKAARTKLADLGIAEEWWDQPPAPRPNTPADSSPKAPANAKLSGPIAVQALYLQDELNLILGELKNDDAATPTERLKVINACAGILKQIGHLTGELTNISEERVLKLPAWRNIQQAITETLTPWPEALRAMGIKLEELGAE